MASRVLQSCGLAIVFFLLASLQTAVAAPRDTSVATHNVERRADGLSADSIIKKSIEALGGQSTLENVKTISSHAKFVESTSNIGSLLTC